MKAIVTVVGKDKKGIIARVSNVLFDSDVNIVDISQTIMQDMFTMIMMIDIDNVSVSFGDFATHMNEFGKEIGMDIRVMHENIFNSMHRI